MRARAWRGAALLLGAVQVWGGGVHAWRVTDREEFQAGTAASADATLSSGNLVLGQTDRRTTLAVTLPKVLSHASAVYDPVRNIVYVFGGFDENEIPVSDIVAFNPGTGTATLMGVALPSGRASTSAVWDTAANVAYVFGGTDGNEQLSTIARFNPATNQVTTVSGTLPTARELTSAVWDPVGNVAYVFGGMTGATLHSQIVKFDPNSGVPVSVLTAVLPTARRYTAAVWDTARSVAYVFGGFAGGTYIDSILRFNPATNQVDALSTILPQPRQAMPAAWDPAKQVAYLFGGLNGAGVLSTIIKYDPGAGTAGALDLTLLPKNDAMAAWDVSRGVAYVLGGMETSRSAAIVQIGPGFGSSGAWTSPAKNRLEDGGGPWARLAWGPDSQPSGTTLRVQLAGSQNASGPWSYVGPDGSAASFYTDPFGTDVWNGHRDDAYLRMKVSFSSADPLLSPTLSEAVVTYATSSSLSSQPAASRVKAGDAIPVGGTVPVFSGSPSVAVALRDQKGRVIADGIGSHSVSVASDGTVSGSAVLGALAERAPDASAVRVEVTVTESGGSRSSSLTTGLWPLEGAQAAFKAYDNRIRPLLGEKAVLRAETAKTGRLLIRVYTAAGETVRTLVDEEKSAGVHLWEWDGRNGSGEMVASGIYLVQAVGPDLSRIEKVAVIK